jgi:hypothetical protein
MLRRRNILWIIILIVIDQLIKIVIYNYSFNLRFELIPSVLEFYPKFNLNYSYVNDLYNLNIGLLVHTVFMLTMLIIMIFIFYYWKKINHTTLLDISFIFFIAGYVCVLIGYFFWKEGILDYISLIPLSIIFDLKDLYLNCFSVLLIIYILKTIKRII